MEDSESLRGQQQGEPKDIYEEPENKFVAGFVGESNLFKAQVVEGPGNYKDGQKQEKPRKERSDNAFA